MVEITGPEAERQFNILTELRSRQHQALVQSGIARRILNAGVPVNFNRNTDEFTEGTKLYPTRKRIDHIPFGVVWGIKESLSGSGRELPQTLTEWEDYLLEYPGAEMLMLGRLEPHLSGYHESTVFVALQSERDNPEPEIKPLDGIDIVDAVQLGAMLREVEAQRERDSLSCLDEESLVNIHMGASGIVPVP